MNRTQTPTPAGFRHSDERAPGGSPTTPLDTRLHEISEAYRRLLDLLADLRREQRPSRAGAGNLDALISRVASLEPRFVLTLADARDRST